MQFQTVTELLENFHKECIHFSINKFAKYTFDTVNKSSKN